MYIQLKIAILENVEKLSTSTNLENYKPQLCIAGKISRCERIVSQIYRKHLADFNITISQLSILSVVAKKKGGVTQKLLSDLLFLEKSTVSRNLRRLFNNAYLVKTPPHEIKITDSGKLLLEKVIPVWDKAMLETREILKNDGENAVDLIVSRLTKN